MRTRERAPSIWTRPERAARGPSPEHSRAEIAAAGIGLADASGLSAVTMRSAAAAMLGAAMQAPLAGLALIMELTHGGFALMIPLLLATVTATVVARHIDGYSIYSARLRARPLPPVTGTS